MPLTSYDDFLARIGTGHWLNQPFWGEMAAAAVNLGGTLLSWVRLGHAKNLPDPLPSGVTSYVVTQVAHSQSRTGSASDHVFLFGRLIDLGNLDIAGPTFTDGAAMPSYTELGVSRQIPSPILIEVTTALNSSPGSMTVTYQDQDANTAETTASQALGASATVGSSGSIALNDPDWGAIDITTATRTGGSSPTGIVQFWGIHPLCASLVPAQTEAHCENIITSGVNLLHLPAGAALGGFMATALTNHTKAILGNIFVVGDS